MMGGDGGREFVTSGDVYLCSHTSFNTTQFSYYLVPNGED